MQRRCCLTHRQKEKTHTQPEKQRTSHAKSYFIAALSSFRRHARRCSSSLRPPSYAHTSLGANTTVTCGSSHGRRRRRVIRGGVELRGIIRGRLRLGRGRAGPLRGFGDAVLVVNLALRGLELHPPCQNNTTQQHNKTQNNTSQPARQARHISRFWT